MSPFLDYDLPRALIAQEPCQPRDQARLLVARRRDGAMAHHRFLDLPQLLQPGDLLVLNDTKVLPARLLGRRARSGGKWEGLFLRTFADGSWELLCQTRGRLFEGEPILLEPGSVRLELVEKLPGGAWRARCDDIRPAVEILDALGHVPLPHYIRKGTALPEDRARYQTIYARHAGAVAAPTAGLHFTPQVFERLQACGIAWTHVTLHVGLGTFRPLDDADYSKHQMHAEWGRLSAEAVQAIEQCQQQGGRVIAVGTTSVRILETAAQIQPLATWSGETSLYIHPPFSFRVVGGLVTNFHLPRTTLLLLVNAFAGPELTARAYRTASAESYRFFSYGDAMLIL